MKTIEARAREASYANLDRLSPAFEVGYIKGATEQQVIDIDKACEYLAKFNKQVVFQVNIDDFRKAMKGE